nr:unnamed protein product [Callosobruchus chinensis]
MATDRFGESAGNLEDISKHLSLLLTNIDMTLHYPQQLAPNIIPVGGCICKRQDLQIIMDSAKEGVILFSLGTVVRLGYLKHSTMVAILKALGKLDQTVILKSELNLTNVPSNVIVRNWVPQLELLAHPNTKLFISHGGCHSTMEAAYYGVPVLGIPFFCDQYMNTVMMESKRTAKLLHYSTITEDTLYGSIREMLNNTIDHFAMLQAVLLIIVAGYVSGANILVVQDIPSPSHSIWTTELATGLVKKGHNVTWLGPGNFKKHKPMNNFHPIYLDGFLVSFSDNMSFLERLTNYFWINMDLFLRQMYLKPQVQKLAVTKFGEDMDVEVMRRHVSLLLVNVDATLHYPQQLAPNVIPVGGLHVQRAGQLPQDLKSIMDSSKKGVILFSLGTNVRSDKLKPEIKTAVLKALGKLDQTVIWKFETNLTGVPSNVIIRKWIPQTEILAHPKTVLFISHGGGLSTIEAAYYGVPVLGMPFFVDQFMNLVMMENKGIARQINIHTLTMDGLYNSIKEMLNNKKYAKNMKETSSRMRDQVQTPLERAVYWIEYSIRHNGTHFLNLKSRDLPLFIANGLDIHLFLLLVGCATLLVIISVVVY